jgi:hypothetical protein
MERRGVAVTGQKTKRVLVRAGAASAATTRPAVFRPEGLALTAGGQRAPVLQQNRVNLAKPGPSCAMDRHPEDRDLSLACAAAGEWEWTLLRRVTRLSEHWRIEPDGRSRTRPKDLEMERDLPHTLPPLPSSR